VTVWRNQGVPFGVTEKDRLRHVYVIGKTGTGKTTLLSNMFLTEVKRGVGGAYLDPQGDVFTHLLAHCRELKDRVVVFDPADREWPVGLNLLEVDEGMDRDLVCAQAIGIFRLLFGSSWGPRMENILRNAILLLLENPGSTLVDIPKVLLDREERYEMLRRVTNPLVFSFWMREAEGMTQGEWSKSVQPVLNKVGRFVSNPIIRNIVGQRRCTVDFRKVLDEGGVILANLSKGRIGGENTHLLGAILIARLWLAALSRYDMDEKERKPFFLYVDEFQDFAFSGFLEMFSQARKYGLGLVVANQFLAQLDDEIRHAVFGNVATEIVFTIGAGDAKLMSQEFAPYLDYLDFVNLPAHHMYLRLCIDGVTSPPFSARSFPPLFPEIPWEERKKWEEEVREASRRKYATPRAKVEEELVKGDALLQEFVVRTRGGEFGGGVGLEDFGDPTFSLLDDE
jgi:type IV secretory pathway TraG/TraD family ATPase VirD4